jgi:hypothetical protein
VIEIRTDLLAEFISLDHSQAVTEFAIDHLRLASIVLKMRLLARDFEVPGTDEVAGNIFFFHNTLDRIDAFKRSSIHAPRKLAPIGREELIDTQLQPGKHHATVAGTRAPANGFGFEHHHLRPAFRK